MKFWFVPVVAVAVSACSNVSFHSNLDPRNITEYYKPSQVEVIESDSELDKRPYKLITQVKGMACQLNERDYIATEADARTEARLKAVDAGANAIRFGKCVRIEKSPACQVSVTCYAKALRVDEQE